MLKKWAYYTQERCLIILKKCAYCAQEKCLLSSRNVPIMLKKNEKDAQEL